MKDKVLTTNGLEKLPRALSSKWPLEINRIILGTSTESPERSQNFLREKVHEDDEVSTLCSFSQITEDEVALLGKITVTGGSHVPAGTEVSEFGIGYNDGTLVQTIVRDPITVNDNDQIQFNVPFIMDFD